MRSTSTSSQVLNNNQIRKQNEVIYENHSRTLTNKTKRKEFAIAEIYLENFKNPLHGSEPKNKHNLIPSFMSNPNKVVSRKLRNNYLSTG